MNKKLPCIPPIFRNNKFIIDFREKADIYNSFFDNQWSLFTNTSELPNNCESLTDKSDKKLTNLTKITKLYALSLGLSQIRGLSLYREKKATLCLFIKKKKPNNQSIKNYIDHFAFFRYAGKLLKDCCITKCFPFSLKTV